MQDRGRCIDGDEAGSGKTPTTLEFLGRVAPKRSLILATNDIAPQWIERNQEGWGASILVVDGRGAAKQRAAARQRVAESSSPTALVLNYEAARADVGELLGLKVEALVCDEAHYLKNHSGVTFKAVAKLARRAKHVTLLTGTPVLNHPEELWPLLHLCNPKQYRSYWRWVGEHFKVLVTDFHGTIPQPTRIVGDLYPGHDDAIRSELADVLLSRTGLLGDLPEPEFQVIEVELSAAERAAYDELDRKDWTLVDGEHFVQTVNTVSKIVRHRQLASDWSSINDSLGAGTKVRAAAGRIADLGHQQSVVFTGFKGAARRLAELLGTDAVLYTGDETPAERQSAKASFVRGDAGVLIGTYGTMCEGVDGLQVAHQMLLLDREWTPSRNWQAIGREHRAGQEHPPVQVHSVIALDTIDQDVSETIHRKQVLIDSVI